MKIGFGADHGGYILKDYIMKGLEGSGHELVDFGVNSGDSVDYPDYAKAVAEKVADKSLDLGIVICGTGIGIGIAANKVKGIRCALIYDEFSARMAKRHNNANMLSLGARTLGDEKTLFMIKAFLEEEYEGARHEKRLKKIHEIEEI